MSSITVALYEPPLEILGTKLRVRLIDALPDSLGDH